MAVPRYGVGLVTERFWVFSWLVSVRVVNAACVAVFTQLDRCFVRIR